LISFIVHCQQYKFFNPKWDWKVNTNPYISWCSNYVIVIQLKLHEQFFDLPRWDGILQKKLFNILLLIILALRDSFDLITYSVWETFECFLTCNFFQTCKCKMASTAISIRAKLKLSSGERRFQRMKTD